MLAASADRCPRASLSHHRVNDRMQSSVHQTEALLFFTLLQLIVIVLAARVAGELAVRAAQSRAVGEIVAGLVLGPSLFGVLLPETFSYVFRSVPPEPMTILSQVGLILLMFQIGLEFDFGHLAANQNRNAVLRISVAGLAAALCAGSAVRLVLCASPGARHQCAGLLSIRRDRLLDYRLADPGPDPDGA